MATHPHASGNGAMAPPGTGPTLRLRISSRGRASEALKTAVPLDMPPGNTVRPRLSNDGTSRLDGRGLADEHQDGTDHRASPGRMGRIWRSFCCRRAMRFTGWCGARSHAGVFDHRLKWLGIEDDVELHDGNLLDLSSLARIVQEVQPDEVYNLAAQSFVTASWQQPILTGADHGPGRGQPARMRAHAEARCALLPGLVVGDVRPDPGAGAERGDAVLPALALWRGQALRALDDDELPRELRAARLERHPVQPREPAARRRVRDPQGHRRRGADQARAGQGACGSATSTPSATGAMPRTTSGRCG